MSFETVMPPYGSTDPNASFLSSSCLDFLLIELVPLAYRVTQELDTAAVAAAGPAPDANGAGDAVAGESQAGGSVSAAGAAAGTAVSASRKMDEDEERDAVFYRLEKLGYRVGQGLVERYVPPLPQSAVKSCFRSR